MYWHCIAWHSIGWYRKKGYAFYWSCQKAAGYSMQCNIYIDTLSKSNTNSILLVYKIEARYQPPYGHFKVNQPNIQAKATPLIKNSEILGFA
jgi:hypothetical protein